MAIFDLFSKRQKRLRGEVPEIYKYHDIPSTLRVQIIHILRDTIGEDIGYSYNSKKPAEELYDFLHETLCREYGLFSLTHDSENEEQVLNFLLKTEKIEQVFDIIELAFKSIEVVIKNDYNNYKHYVKVKISPIDAINELNQRFKENGVGYSLERNEIIRVDSTYIHTEITKPTIALLWTNKFRGANEEFLKAHEYYRLGKNKECLMECLKAFESTMKIICIEKKWTFNQTDTAKKLIQVCFQNGLVPTFTQNQFTSLQNLLESGIPTIRNKLGGHGQGQVPQTVDNGMTRYGLNLTGSNIIFLIEQSGLSL
jgi:hypothetical protein